MTKQYLICPQRIRELREQKSISLGLFATRLGVSKSFINAIEKTKRPVPKTWLLSLLQILDVKPEELLIYPTFSSSPWRSGRVPNGFWKEEKNRKWFFEWLQELLSLSYVSELLNLPSTELRKIISQNGGGAMFSSFYQNSIRAALSQLFPTLALPKDKRMPRGASKDQTWVRQFLESLLEKHSYSQIEDFYQVKVEMLYEHGGYGVYETHKSLYAIAKFAFPEYEWLPWKFNVVRSKSGYWNDPKNLKEYLEWLHGRLGYTKIEDYYLISRKNFKDNSGSGLLSLYGGSPSAIIMKAFPDYDWKQWLFSKAPQGYWQKKPNRLDYLKWFEEKLGISNSEDWYTISKSDFEANKGSGLLAYYQGSPAQAAKELYPDSKWKEEEFGLLKKRQQRLFHVIKDIFPNQKVEWEYEVPNLHFALSNAKVSVDIFIPHYNLAIEYQGEQHFSVKESWGGEETLKEIKRRDLEKWEKLFANGINLVEVDYTWDGKKEFIEAIVLDWIEDSQLEFDNASLQKNSKKQEILDGEEIRNLTASWEMRFSQLQEFRTCLKSD